MFLSDPWPKSVIDKSLSRSKGRQTAKVAFTQMYHLFSPVKGSIISVCRFSIDFSCFIPLTFQLQGEYTACTLLAAVISSSDQASFPSHLLALPGRAIAAYPHTGT